MTGALQALRVGLVGGTLLATAACSTARSPAPAADPTRVRSSPTATPTSQTPTPTPTRTAKPKPPPVPAEYACYRLTYDDALAPTSDRGPVPCTEPHTAITFYVGRFGADLPVDGPRVHDLVSTVCPRRFATFVGGTVDGRRLSLLRTIWFTPTLAQAEAGARWFRCEAIALRDEHHLASLTGRLAGALDRSDARARFGLCGTTDPSTPGFRQRSCSTTHGWQALTTVDFPAGRYPGLTRVRSAGEQPCQDAGRQVANDPLSYRWSYQWPSLQQWRTGQTYGVCWAPAS